MRVTIAIVVLLAGCATQPPVPPAGTPWRATVVWHEVENPHAVCRRLLNEVGRSRNIADGCYRWIGGELHIVTRVVTQEHHFCTVGHELGHGKRGKFHDADGNWIN